MSIPLSAQPPPQQKPRKKRQADDVSFEDLLAAHRTDREPGQLPPEGVVLIGVDIELQRRMAEGIVPPSPSPAKKVNPSPNFDALKFDAPINSSAKRIDAPNISAPIINPNEAPNIDAPEIGAPEFDLRDLLARRNVAKTYTVQPIRRIEDVFTAAERDLLRWLWDRGCPVPARSIRLVTGPNGEGARRLATQAGLIYNTFKNLTRALATKFALDIVKPERNLPMAYVIYDCPAILDRQRQGGFIGVVRKNGGGRELVNRQSQSARRRPDLTVEELEKVIGAYKFGAPISSS